MWRVYFYYLHIYGPDKTPKKEGGPEDADESEEPPSKMFRIDMEGTHGDGSNVDQQGDIQDDAVSVQYNHRHMHWITRWLISVVDKLTSSLFQSVLKIEKLGSVLRSRGDKVSGLCTDGRVVACHSKSPTIDLFIVLTDEEVKEKAAKRLRKANKRAR